MRHTSKITVTVLVIPLTWFMCTLAVAQRDQSTRPKRIRLPSGHTSVTLVGEIQERSSRVYRIRSRVGQTLSVEIKPLDPKVRHGDVVFWIQSREYIENRNTKLLDGIDRGGVLRWTGRLPISGDYDLYVSRPPVNDHPVIGVIRFKLMVSIE
jgi:hypothetical protein